MLKSESQRNAEIAETFRQYNLQDLRGAEFRRLLRLAHAEGLLAGLLRDNGIPIELVADRDALGRQDRQASPENQSIPSLSTGPDCLHSACGWWCPKSAMLRHTQRWNIERDGSDLMICTGDHEKSEPCEFHRYRQI